MKTKFNYNFNIKLFIVFILFIALFFLSKSTALKANNIEESIDLVTFNDSTEIKMAVHNRSDNIGGWAWSPNFGWLSLSCYNDFDGDGTLENECYVDSQDADYGLYIDNNYIKGCAWSDSVGYICFNNEGGDQAPEGGIEIMQSGKINSLNSGNYASILGYEYINGDDWRLGFPVDEKENGYSGDIRGCFNCEVSYECNSGSQGQDPGTTCNKGDHSFCIGNTGYGMCIEVNSCDNCLEYTYNEGDLESVYSGYNCSDCQNIDSNASCVSASYDIDEEVNIASCNSCADYRYSIPGTILDNTYEEYTVSEEETRNVYSLCGFAWNSFGAEGDLAGLGYLQFSPKISYDFNPYFQVEEGSIYALGNINLNTFIRYNVYNSKYFIKSTGDIDAVSNLGTSSGNLANYENLGFLEMDTDSGKYENALGKIDYKGLTTIAYTDDSNNDYNKYGSEITEDCSDLNSPSINIDNKVYDCSDISSINNNLTISGSGIVILKPEDGLVTFNNSNYEEAEISNINDIHAIVWIVKGDIQISDTVQSLVGNFVVLGKDNEEDCNEDGNYCGRFKSGEGGTQLKVYGSIIARYFELYRHYTDNDEAAEQIINDGRLQANPPAGLVDFSKALPRFSNRIN